LYTALRLDYGHTMWAPASVLRVSAVAELLVYWTKVRSGSSYLWYYYYRPRTWRGNAFDRVCLYVCLFMCPVPALTFESLDLETSLLVHRYIF